MFARDLTCRRAFGMRRQRRLTRQYPVGSEMAAVAFHLGDAARVCTPVGTACDDVPGE